jgi:hypothetical protein
MEQERCPVSLPNADGCKAENLPQSSRAFAHSRLKIPTQRNLGRSDKYMESCTPKLPIQMVKLHTLHCEP